MRKQHCGPLLAALVAAGLTPAAWGQSPPTWGAESNPSPTASSGISRSTNAAADKGMYKDVKYTNAAKPGVQVVVVPGEVKSSNNTFSARYGSNSIADFGELELTKANFRVLDRAELQPMMNEISMAYSAGDPEEARNVMQKGRLKTTKYVVRFDILKAEQVAQAKRGFNGGVAGSLIGILARPSVGSEVASTVATSVDTGASAGVWVIGMRYKIMDATTTEQIATGYTEEKMEVGAGHTSVGGLSGADSGGVSLDTMVQRLVQKSVWDIDYKFK